MLQAPCKDCSDRHQNCWSECEKYRTFRALMDAVSEKKQKHHAEEDDFFRAIHKYDPKRRR